MLVFSRRRCLSQRTLNLEGPHLVSWYHGSTWAPNMCTLNTLQEPPLTMDPTWSLPSDGALPLHFSTARHQGGFGFCLDLKAVPGPPVLASGSLTWSTGSFSGKSICLHMGRQSSDLLCSSLIKMSVRLSLVLCCQMR